MSLPHNKMIADTGVSDGIHWVIVLGEFSFELYVLVATGMESEAYPARLSLYDDEMDGHWHLVDSDVYLPHLRNRATEAAQHVVNGFTTQAA